MNTAAYRKNIRRLLIMVVLAALAAAAYMLVEVNFENQKLFAYAMKIRTPKLIAMLITAFAIGGASIVFQSVINNTIVTPCLLGMNSLYTLIHTAIVFFFRCGKPAGDQCESGVRRGPGSDGSRGNGGLQLSVQEDETQCAVCAADRNCAFLVFFQYPDHSDTGDGSQRV